MSVTEEQILAALRTVPYPGYSRDVVSSGVIRDLAIEGQRVRFTIRPASADMELARKIEHNARRAVERVAGVEAVETRIAATAPAPASAPELRVVGAKPSAAASGGVDRGLIPDVRHTLAVASGKGGVGKSTVAVNLAVALARRGARVGLLDADIYGPSIPIMMGLQHEKPRFDSATRRLIPFEKYGVRFMSLGFLVEPDSAVIWRGPMVMKAIEQLLRDVEWGPLDLLVVDMPPGTGDAQLTLSQRVQLAGSVIVTTPQDVALADAIKGVAMFRKVEVPVLGLIENMSYFECPGCSERSEIFGHGGGREQALRLGVPFLGELPLDPRLRSSGDRGTPLTAEAGESTVATAFLGIADTILSGLQLDGATPQEQPSGNIFERYRKVLKEPRD